MNKQGKHLTAKFQLTREVQSHWASGECNTFPQDVDMELEFGCILHIVLAWGMQYLCCLILPHLGFCQCSLSCLPVRGGSKQSSLRSQLLREAREMQVRSSAFRLAAGQARLQVNDTCTLSPLPGIPSCGLVPSVYGPGTLSPLAVYEDCFRSALREPNITSTLAKSHRWTCLSA